MVNPALHTRTNTCACTTGTVTAYMDGGISSVYVEAF